MFSGFSVLLRSLRPLTSRAGVMIQQRTTYINSKPPKEKIGAAESAFVLTVMAVAVFGPAVWILAHLDHYKSRD